MAIVAYECLMDWMDLIAILILDIIECHDLGNVVARVDNAALLGRRGIADVHVAYSRNLRESGETCHEAIAVGGNFGVFQPEENDVAQTHAIPDHWKKGADANAGAHVE